MTELKVMIDGGKATAGAPLGPALGPTGVNIGEVVAQINSKTSALSGMKVPVTIVINKDKSFTLDVGLPPTSALIKKECKAEKGAANPKENVIGNLTIQQIIKIGEMKYDKVNSYVPKKIAKEIIGTCDSMGVRVEGMKAVEAIKALDAGKFDSAFK
jgi:large subunit ribosomal protein L11